MICKYIGISQIKCGVHIFNLVALALNHLKNFKYLVAGLGKLIYQGGGTKRAMEIEALGLSPRSMLTHDGRFGTHVETGNYVLTNFDKIRTWVTTSSLNVKPPQTKVKGAKGAAAGGGAGAGAVADEGAVEEDEDEDEEDILPDDEELESKEVAAAKHVERVVRAWSSPFAVVTLEISRDFFGNLNAILTQLSGEGDNVPPDVLVTISAYQRRLKIVQGDPGSIVRPALSKHNLRMPQRDFEEVSASVKAMADLALEKLDKHLPPYVTLLKHRFIYTPRQMPPPHYLRSRRKTKRSRRWTCASPSWAASTLTTQRRFLISTGSTETTFLLRSRRRRAYRSKRARAARAARTRTGTARRTTGRTSPRSRSGTSTSRQATFLLNAAVESCVASRPCGSATARRTIRSVAR